MKFHYAGKYDGDETKLPQREHPENYVPFKEPDIKKLSLYANFGCVFTILFLAAVVIWRLHDQPQIENIRLQLIVGCVLPTLFLPIHEFLHAIVFKKEVYMYNNLRQGLMFVVGNEDMSKARFIIMSLCPNILLGVIPFIAFLLMPRFVGLGAFGAISLGMGFGDYINVFNAIKQMPSNAKTYLSGTHSFWYVQK